MVCIDLFVFVVILDFAVNRRDPHLVLGCDFNITTREQLLLLTLWSDRLVTSRANHDCGCAGAGPQWTTLQWSLIITIRRIMGCESLQKNISYRNLLPRFKKKKEEKHFGI